ncbi:MAG TPA: hypothetical protein VFT21_05895, partial [Gemmatimonadaceae bacterium]|nr:hypothetical protein [Gemmatimonadaceae bacterium]
MKDRLLQDPVDTHDFTAREYASANTAQPKITILGSAPFTTILTNAGGGQTRAGSLAVTRWRSDPTLDDFGQWFYVRDVAMGRTWSAAHQPVCAKPSSYRVRFENDRASFHRVDGDIETLTEIVVSSTNGTDIRRITVSNNSDRPREIEITSYSEIVIAPSFTDRGHPAFSNLFVQTEWIEKTSAILAMRRPRSAVSKPVWCGHVLSVGGEQNARASCETDRAKFVGRGRSGRSPAAMDGEGDLSGRVGSVLDPVFAIRTRLTVPPRESAVATFTTFVAADRDHAVKLAAAYHDASDTASAFEKAISESRDAAAAFGISSDGVAQSEELAGHFLFGLHSRSPEARSRNVGEVADLNALGISGVVPILLASIDSVDGLPALKQLVEIHRYWMHKGIACDLVFLTADDIPGIQLVADGVASAVTEMNAEQLLAYTGGIFFLRADRLDAAQLSLLHAHARMEVVCGDFDLEQFLERIDSEDGYDSEEVFANEPLALVESEQPQSVADLQFFNGIGGFNDANEYEIRLTGENLPPAPWINVVANPSGGFIASEAGNGPTWAVNSSGYRLTPWHNDPVRDRSGECIYIIDIESGDVWTPTAAPIRDGSPYITKHGAGYSIFEHEHDGIATSLRMGVPESDPVKLQVLTLRNESTRPRQLSIVSYVEWVLGGVRELTRFNVRTSFDEENELMFANNRLHLDIPDTVSFVALSEPLRGRTASRREFIGRNGTLSAPRWLTRQDECSDD